jgi:anti-sigma B factor antagonist
VTEPKQVARAGYGAVVVPLPATLDHTSARAVVAELAATFTAGASTVIADLTGTSFCDSSGTRMLAMAYVQAIERKVRLFFAIPGPAVRQALQASGLDRVLPIFPSLDEALAMGPAARG